MPEDSVITRLRQCTTTSASHVAVSRTSSLSYNEQMLFVLIPGLVQSEPFDNFITRLANENHVPLQNMEMHTKGLDTTALQIGRAVIDGFGSPGGPGIDL